jgi:Zn-dependent protease
MVFAELLFNDPQFFLMWILIVIFSVSCHEYFHAQVALWEGDATAAKAGHLTLNPLKQMGPFSLIMLIFIGIAWGSVPVSPSRMKHRYSGALVSLAGPFANLLIFIFSILALSFIITLKYKGISLFQYGIKPYFKEMPPALLFFFTTAYLNLVLFIFNMLPFPILDGWDVFTYIFPGLRKLDRGTEITKGFYLFAFLFIFVFIGYIFYFAQITTIFLSAFAGVIFQLAGV